MELLFGDDTVPQKRADGPRGTTSATARRSSVWSTVLGLWGLVSYYPANGRPTLGCPGLRLSISAAIVDTQPADLVKQIFVEVAGRQEPVPLGMVRHILDELRAIVGWAIIIL